MNTVSTADGRRQQYLSADFDSESNPEIIPFDAAGSFDDGDDNPTSHAGANAIGLPCRRGGETDRRHGYSLCAVMILPDPNYPATTDDADYYADGQEMLGFHSPVLAQRECDRYARQPELLPLIEIPGVNFLVVNDDRGREIYRRPISLREKAA